MDIADFKAIMAQDPRFAFCLNDEVGPECMNGGRDHRDMSREEWIEQHVGEIVARPLFAAVLDLQNQGAETAAELSRVLVYYHYEGDASYRVARQSGNDTLLDTLVAIDGKHPQLVLDLLVVHTKTRVQGRRYYQERFALYPLTPQQSRSLLARREIIDDDTFMEESLGN